jgi:hypothetical protein
MEKREIGKIFWCGNLSGRKRLEALYLDGGIVLMGIVGKYVFREWTGFY